eukprot:6202514-Pleurochrysis_carterae.AAC.2
MHFHMSASFRNHACAFVRPVHGRLCVCAASSLCRSVRLTSAASCQFDARVGEGARKTDSSERLRACAREEAPSRRGTAPLTSTARGDEEAPPTGPRALLAALCARARGSSAGSSAGSTRHSTRHSTRSRSTGRIRTRSRWLFGRCCFRA